MELSLHVHVPFLRLRSVATGDRTPISRTRGNALPLPHRGVLNIFYKTSRPSYTPANKVRPSVRLSGQIRFWAVNYLCCNIGIPNLAHGCITMRRCVAYIHDPDTTLTFDPKVKFEGFLK